MLMYVQLLGMNKSRELETWRIQEAKQKQIFVDIAGIAMTTVQKQQAAMGYPPCRSRSERIVEKGMRWYPDKEEYVLIS
jgi:hypothetical protein